MSKNESVDRTRGPKIQLATSLDKNDEVLVIGLVSPESSEPEDSTKTDSDAAPTLFIGDGLLDDAQADRKSVV